MSIFRGIRGNNEFHSPHFCPKLAMPFKASYAKSMHQDMHRARSKLAGISVHPSKAQTIPALFRSHQAAHHLLSHLQFPTVRSHLVTTYPASRISTSKRPILSQERSPGPPFKSRQRSNPPLGLCQGSPLPWDPIPHHAVIPGHHCQTAPRRPGGIPMQIIRPCQHGSLTTRQKPILKPPGMHPKLLPVEVTYLYHAILSKKGVCMVPALLSCHQACNLPGT